MRSPGSRIMNRLSYHTMWATLNTIVSVEPSCIRSPLTPSVMDSAWTSSTSSGVTSQGLSGLYVSQDLPLTHWPPRSI